MKTYKVLLASDRMIHQFYLESILHASKRYTVVDTVPTMTDALKCCNHTSADIILTEAVDRSGALCFQAVAECRKKYPGIRIIVMTDLSEYSFLEQAEVSGANGFWHIEDKKYSILSILDGTMEGKSIFPDQLPSVKVGQVESCNLTEKELLVLQEVVNGCSNREIGEKLNLSYYTIRDYIESLLGKTKLKSRTELAVAAVASGLVLPKEKAENPSVDR